MPSISALEQPEPHRKAISHIGTYYGRKNPALEQPEQDVPETDCGNIEPVAWVDCTELKHLSDDFEPVISKRAVSEYDIPLYTHPPRRTWQGLTEEEIYPLYSEPSSDAEMVDFARAIEARLKEKNT